MGAQTQTQDGQAHKEGGHLRYGTRYGATLRKVVKKYEISRTQNTCVFCGKDSVKRTNVGIWKCQSCSKITAGGAWQPSTTAAVAAKSTIRRLREMTEI